MRISKKVVLEYFESVYPAWKTFEQIADEVPTMINFDMFELQDRLDRLCEEGKIEKEPPFFENCLSEGPRYRSLRKIVSYEEYQKELQHLGEEFIRRTCVPGIGSDIWFTRKNSHKEPLELLVNFFALGAVTPVVASRYADCIKEAAELAKSFKYNGFIIK